MISYLTNFFKVPERNSLCPNSLAPMPKYVFHNYAIEKGEHNDDEEPTPAQPVHEEGGEQKAPKSDTIQ